MNDSDDTLTIKGQELIALAKLESLLYGKHGPVIDYDNYFSSVDLHVLANAWLEKGRVDMYRAYMDVAKCVTNNEFKPSVFVNLVTLLKQYQRTKP